MRFYPIILSAQMTEAETIYVGTGIESGPGPHSVEHLFTFFRGMTGFESIDKIVQFDWMPDEDYAKTTMCDEWSVLVSKIEMPGYKRMYWGAHNSFAGPMIICRKKNDQLYPWEIADHPKTILEFIANRQRYWAALDEPDLRGKDKFDTLDALLYSIQGTKK